VVVVIAVAYLAEWGGRPLSPTPAPLPKHLERDPGLP